MTQLPCTLLAAQMAPRGNWWARGGMRRASLWQRVLLYLVSLTLPFSILFFFFSLGPCYSSRDWLFWAPCALLGPSRGCGPKTWRRARAHPPPLPLPLSPSPPSASVPGRSAGTRGGRRGSAAWPRPRSRFLLGLPRSPSAGRLARRPGRAQRRPLAPLRLRHTAPSASAAASARAHPRRRQPRLLAPSSWLSVPGSGSLLLAPHALATSQVPALLPRPTPSLSVPPQPLSHPLPLACLHAFELLDAAKQLRRKIPETFAKS